MGRKDEIMEKRHADNLGGPAEKYRSQLNIILMIQMRLLTKQKQTYRHRNKSYSYQRRDSKKRKTEAG